MKAKKTSSPNKKVQPKVNEKKFGSLKSGKRDMRGISVVVGKKLEEE